MLRSTTFTALGFSLLLVQSASAHYPWLVIDQKTGENGTVEFVFEEGPRKGDGRYLDPFLKRGTCWIRTVDGKPAELKLAETRDGGFRWLSAPLPVKGPRSIDLNTRWGVYRYGKTDVLLHYNARVIDARKPETVAALAKSTKLNVQLVPEWDGKQLTATLLWDGKPVANRPVDARGPVNFRQKLTTDEAGKISIPTDNPGRYLIKSWVVEPKSTGTFEGKDYQQVRRHATLLLTLPAKKKAE